VPTNPIPDEVLHVIAGRLLERIDQATLLQKTLHTYTGDLEKCNAEIAAVRHWLESQGYDPDGCIAATRKQRERRF
jgi:hypothetical protein